MDFYGFGFDFAFVFVAGAFSNCGATYDIVNFGSLPYRERVDFQRRDEYD